MAFDIVTHVIFDMDGLLLDTVSAYNQIMKRIVVSEGYSYTTQLKRNLLGRNRLDCARIVVKHCENSLSIDEYLEIYNKHHSSLLNNCALMPGAEKLIRHLHKHGIPMAVGTSSSIKSVAIKTKPHSDLFSLVNHFTCGLEDPMVAHGKPSPDIFLAAAARFNPPAVAESCLVFEDAPNGVQAALAANMQVVMVPDLELTNRDDTYQATQTIDSLLSFRPEDFGLPPFESDEEAFA